MAGLFVAILTILRCRNHWQLLVLAIWKLSMSLFNGIAGIHVAIAGFWDTGTKVENEGHEESGNDDKEAPKVRLGVFSWFVICLFSFYYGWMMF